MCRSFLAYVYALDINTKKKLVQKTWTKINSKQKAKIKKKRATP